MLRPRYVRRRVRKWRNPKNFKASAKGVADMAYRGLALATKVAKLINVEFKYIDLASTVAVPSTGTVVHLTPCAQGDNDDERNGNQFKLKSIFLRLYGDHNSSGATSQLVRMILFQDKMGQGVFPAVTDVLQTANILSPLNRSHDGRVRILKDKVLNLTADRGQAYRKIYMGDIDTIVEYKGASAVENNTGTNQIFLLLVSNEASINYPNIIYNSRLRFIDN